VYFVLDYSYIQSCMDTHISSDIVREVTHFFTQSADFMCHFFLFLLIEAIIKPVHPLI